MLVWDVLQLSANSTVALHILAIQSCRLIVELKGMNGEHRPLLTDDPVEFEK